MIFLKVSVLGIDFTSTFLASMEGNQKFYPKIQLRSFVFFSGGAESFFPLLLDIASPNLVCPRGIDNDETREEEEKVRQPGCVPRHPAHVQSANQD